MTDIFISYSSKHRNLTETLAAALETEGYSVWWDKELEAYAPFGQQIDAALSAARVVVVIWSQPAADSDYVIAEAREAMTRGGQSGKGRLVNLLAPGFDGNAIPKPMSELQAHPVEDIAGVVRAVAKRWAGEKPQKLDAAGHYERALGQSALSSKRDAISTVAHVTPALLLNARLAIAPYLDIHGRRAGLLEWAQSQEGKKVRGRLIHGPGGLGKTRLMAEICADLREQGWDAGFVEASPENAGNLHRQAIEGLIDDGRSSGLLLVLDYAERRQDEASRYAERMKKAAQNNPERPLRLVLLARAAGEWWDRILEETPVLASVFARGVEQLSALPEIADRQRLFTEAVGGFRAAIERIQAEDPDEFSDWGIGEGREPAVERLAELAADAFARPLMIQIAALLHLQGETPDTSSIATLLGAMLGVERNYWKKALGKDYTKPRHTALKRGAMQTTLSGGVSRDDAEALLLRDTFFKREAPADAEEALSDLERVLGNGAGMLMAVEPDLVGEHLINEGDTRLLDACLGWASDNTTRRRSMLTVLQRASREEHGPKSAQARRFLEDVIVKNGEKFVVDIALVAQETPGALGELLEKNAPELNHRIANGIENEIPIATIRLASAALSLAERSVQLTSGWSSDEEKAKHAAALHKLGVRHSSLGHRESALNATDESVRLYTELTDRNSRAFLPALANSLNSLGVDLSALGQRERALAATKKAVRIRRDLADQQPNAYLPVLAMSLNNLGCDLADLGRSKEAYDATEEAVSIRRRLVAPNADNFLPEAATALNNLAMSLHNLGRRLSEHGQREAALRATEEAVSIRRDLVASNADAYLPEFALSLNHFGNQLADVGQHEPALAAAKESVSIRRDLATMHSAAFLPGLAISLTGLGKRQSDLGQCEAALLSAEEAVAIYRDLTTVNPTVFLSELANSLSIVGDISLRDNKIESAVAAYEESATIMQPFAVSRPEKFGERQKRCLESLVCALREVGRAEDEIAETIRELLDDPEEPATSL